LGWLDDIDDDSWELGSWESASLDWDGWKASMTAQSSAVTTAGSWAP